jgi:hypothetical protein
MFTTLVDPARTLTFGTAAWPPAMPAMLRILGSTKPHDEVAAQKPEAAE